MSIWRQSLLSAAEMREIEVAVPGMDLDGIAGACQRLGWGFYVGNQYEGQIIPPEIGVTQIDRYADGTAIYGDDDYYDAWRVNGPLIDRLRGALAKALAGHIWRQVEWEADEQQEREFEAAERTDDGRREGTGTNGDDAHDD